MNVLCSRRPAGPIRLQAKRKPPKKNADFVTRRWNIRSTRKFSLLMAISRDVKPAALELLSSWLQRQLPEEKWLWLKARNAKGAETAEKDVFITLGLIPRHLGKYDLDLSQDDLIAAERVAPGWDPRGWSVDGTARVATVLLTIAASNDFPERFRQLCRTADLAEAIALYRGLILYPHAEALEQQAAEGVRSNIRTVFEAIAHDNPYPKFHFDAHRWNQMVLKALFVGSALHPIQGLDERANPDLAVMLRDYAHERWSAGRSVSPELWRCVGPFAESEEALADLQRAANSDDAAERAAAALALSMSPSPAAHDALNEMHGLASRISGGELTWETLARDPEAAPEHGKDSL